MLLCYIGTLSRSIFDASNFLRMHLSKKIHVRFYAHIFTQPMAQSANPPQPSDTLYCPNCAREITDPLICGDCSAVICRVCGTPLESSADLGMG